MKSELGLWKLGDGERLVVAGWTTGRLQMPSKPRDAHSVIRTLLDKEAHRAWWPFLSPILGVALRKHSVGAGGRRVPLQ